ncbi:MAG: class I SAM-dependent methyltransferase, partial [Casimicrobiaceae bacterium]
GMPSAATLLELGAGAGNNAFHLKRRFRCTLSAPSEGVRRLSRELNPECEHIAGDMRSLRLDRTFDAVLIHDAVMYMTSEEDLLAAARTAFEHTRPGGAAVFAPDYVRETFHEVTNSFGGDDAPRALRGLEWTWDPEPADDTYIVEYAFLMREESTVKAVHDRHVEGLFSTATWHRILSSAGFSVQMFERPLDDDGESDQVFLCRRR